MEQAQEGIMVPAASAGMASWNNPANWLTIFRVIVLWPAVLMYPLLGTSSGWRVGAWSVLILAAVTDFLDGRVARRYGWETSLGALVDPIADKLLVGTVLISMSLVNIFPFWATSLILIREVSISILREWARRKSVIIPADTAGKYKLVVQGLMISLYLLPLHQWWLEPPRAILLGAGVGLTLLSAYPYIVRAWHLRQA